MHQLSRHISEQYDAELEIVRRRLMEMGGMVEQQLRDAIKAISTYDAELRCQGVCPRSRSEPLRSDAR